MDNYSSYLKLKIKSDRKLASILDKAVNQVGQNLYDMANDALAGAERAPGICPVSPPATLMYVVNRVMKTSDIFTAFTRQPAVKTSYLIW